MRKLAVFVCKQLPFGMPSLLMQVAWLPGWGGKTNILPVLSCSWWESDGELNQRGSLQQRGGTLEEGEGHKPAMCKGKSGGGLCLLFMQYLHHALQCLGHTNTLSLPRYQGNYNNLKRKKQVFSLIIFQLLVQEVLGFFLFHIRDLLLCAAAHCAVADYVLGECGWCLTTSPMLPRSLGYSALGRDKYCLLSTHSLLQLMGSQEG